ncbi:hypothetical protein NHQ30_009279 [Ciborinia camelliae]|nr:hypothetical protein NHQ30_009279 [Ciborinia camelliae]
MKKIYMTKAKALLILASGQIATSSAPSNTSVSAVSISSSPSTNTISVPVLSGQTVYPVSASTPPQTNATGFNGSSIVPTGLTHTPSYCPLNVKWSASSNGSTVAKRDAKFTHKEAIQIVQSGAFNPTESNLEKIDWIKRFDDWETSARASDSKKSISTRYGEEKIGELNWICDADTACVSKPNPVTILQFVECSEPDMNRDEIIEEAKARYWASMSIWTIYRTASHTVNAMDRAHVDMTTRMDSLVYLFTKQDNPDAILKCDIKTWGINMLVSKAQELLSFSLGFVPGLSAAPIAPLMNTAIGSLSGSVSGSISSSSDTTYYSAASRFGSTSGSSMSGSSISGSSMSGSSISGPSMSGPSKSGIDWKEVVEKAQPLRWAGYMKEILDFSLPMDTGAMYSQRHPAGNETSNPWLVLNLAHTNDLYCGTIDGIAGTGGDNPYRISDSGFYLSTIMRDFRETLSKQYRSFNGQESNPEKNFKMSALMLNVNLEAVIRNQENFDFASYAASWGKEIEGHFISALLASNKCYMKCQNGMDPEDVLSKCHADKFAKHRFCPAEAPDTLCQVNCYTMMDMGNHEKPLIGIDNLPIHGFTVDELKQNSWDNYKEHTNDIYMPKMQMDFMNGTEFNFDIGKKALTLTVSNSKTNIIADNPKKSKNFPCNSGDWRGLEIEGFMKRLGMGPGSTDWGEDFKQNGRSWEVFQSRCPEQTRAMPPLTRYLNIMCGQHLVWPSRSVRDSLVRNRVLKPDVGGKNLEICSGLRNKTAEIDEQAANVLFCTSSWEESNQIFDYEADWVYTDYNDPKHRGSGLRYMNSHKTRCQEYMKDIPHIKNVAPLAGTVATGDEGDYVFYVDPEANN